MNFNSFYDMDVTTFIQYLINNIEKKDITFLLNDLSIKRKLIELSVSDFKKKFLNKVPFKIVSLLLDNGGVELLKNNRFFIVKLKEIIKKFINDPELFKNKDFCNTVCYNMYYIFSEILDVGIEVAIPLINYVFERNDQIFRRVFECLDSKVQLEVIKRINIPDEKLHDMITLSFKEVSQYLMDNDERVTSLLEFNFEELYYHFIEREIKIPEYLLYEDKFVRWVTSIKNVMKYRFLVESLAENQDISFIEEIRKKFYENEINSYDVKEDMLARYSKFYYKLLNRKFTRDNIDELYILFRECFDDFDDSKHIEDLIYNIRECVIKGNYQRVKELLQEESHLQLSSMIIDYHFEDIAHNVFLDIRELLNFNFKVKVISEEDALRYGKIMHLDNLPYQKAKELHEELKSYHYSQFYDDIRAAKDKAIDLMDQVILNEETIQKYRDKKLSKQYGIDVYVLDGDNFYALVRSLGTIKKYLIDKEATLSSDDGNSFTLDCSIKLNTYRNPRECYNLIYSSFPKDQIVHISSGDSYSNFHRERNVEATEKLYEIRTPEELVRAKRNYNEIVMAVKNSNRFDELNANLKAPKILGLYCFDEIIKNDIISAKNLGVGIVLVKSKNYKINLDNFGSRVSFDYIRDVNSLDMVYRKRLYLNKK